LVKRKKKITSSKVSLRTLDKWTTATMKDLEKKVHALEKRVDDLEEELFD